MFKVLFTSDYEIHGSGMGSPKDLVVDPTSRRVDGVGQMVVHRACAGRGVQGEAAAANGEMPVEVASVR